MWIELDRTGRSPRWQTAAPWLIAAVVLHGSYNLVVTLWELAGGSF